MTDKVFLPLLAVSIVLASVPVFAQTITADQNFNQTTDQERLDRLQQLYSKLYGRSPPPEAGAIRAPDELAPAKPPMPVKSAPATTPTIEKPAVPVTPAPAAAKIEPPTKNHDPKKHVQTKKAPSKIAPAATPKNISPVLMAGDKVAVTVEAEPDLSGAFSLDEEGIADLPLIGKIKLSHATTGGAAMLIRNAYLDGYLVNPVVRVSLIKGK